MRPQRRVEGLLPRGLPGELLVYDLEEHRADCLNRAAAPVFEPKGRRDERKGAGEDPALGAGSPAGEGWAELALERLGEAGLLGE